MEISKVFRNIDCKQIKLLILFKWEPIEANGIGSLCLGVATQASEYPNISPFIFSSPITSFSFISVIIAFLVILFCAHEVMLAKFFIMNSRFYIEISSFFLSKILFGISQWQCQSRVSQNSSDISVIYLILQLINRNFYLVFFFRNCCKILCFI